jgi:uncharacterized protein (TIGR02466 family)
MEITSVDVSHLFSAPVYMLDKPEFLDTAKTVSMEFLEKRRGEVFLNEAFPSYMTENLNYDPRMLDFANYVAQTAWEILSEQGYDMQRFETYFESMWCQEHHNLSSMERHIHGNGVVMTGFYFLDCPKDCGKAIFYDPRDAKVITSLPQKDETKITNSSNMVNFVPKPGQLMFSNSWLPHSFSKNTSGEPMRFIHFNVSINHVTPQICASGSVEII